MGADSGSLGYEVSKSTLVGTQPHSQKKDPAREPRPQPVCRMHRHRLNILDAGSKPSIY